MTKKNWLGWKSYQIKISGQGLYRNAVDHIKGFDNDDLGHKTVLPHQYFAAWIINIKTFNMINSIPAQALVANLISQPFNQASFSWPQLLYTLGVFG